MEDMILNEETQIPEEEILAPEQPALEAETPAGEEITQPEAPEPQKKKKGRWLIWLCAAAALVVAVFFLTAKPRKYAMATELYEEGDYLAAAEQFAALEQYKDAPQQVQRSRYALAGDYLVQKEFALALEIYESLGDYEYSPRKVMECSYTLGEEALEAGLLDEAIAYFEKATDDYRDARTKRLQIIYRRGHELYMDSQYEQAQTYFDRLADYPAYNIPHFEDPRDAIAYLKSITDHVERAAVAVQYMSPFYEEMNYWNAAVQQSLGYQFADVTYDEEAHTIHLKPYYYPGQRIVWAWESGDFSGLTQREMETYEKAMTLVELAAEVCEDPMETELWLHDWICENVEYDSPYEYVYPEDYVGLEELTCVGAILDGKANCQGYTDAFYLLGRLAGLEVHKVFGAADGGGHCWNAVRLDGWLYTVDVTFNDTYCPVPEQRTYIWYNNALDMNQYTVSGGVSQFVQMVFLEDLSHTYYTENDMVFDSFSEAVFQLVRQYRKKGDGVYYAVVEGQGYTDDDFYNAVYNAASLTGVSSIRWWVGLETYKEDTYITVGFI